MAELEFVEEEQEQNFEPHIKVIGVGGAGNNAVDGMVDLGLDNVDFYIMNTDVQTLQRAKCPNKLQIGKDVTQGRGAGSDPIIGEKAAIAAKDTITEIVMGADMLFLTAGFGGGTGTGAAPVVAEIAREMGILTIAFITRPFKFEGPQRIKRADMGIARLRESCDALVVISNERLLEVVGNKATLTDAFTMANEVLAQGVKSLSELITVPGLINLDFGDVKSIMSGAGGAVMGVGVGKGENRAVEAVQKACSNRLLDKDIIDGATRILLCVTGSENLKLDEINQASTTVYESADSNANITLGVVLDPELEDEVKVTIIAAGFREDCEPLGRAAAERSRKSVPETPREEPAEEKKNGVTLKEKLEFMLGAENEASREEALEEDEGEELDETEDALDHPDQQDFMVNFNRPDNPLRSMKPKKEESAPSKKEKKMEEEDLDTPAFLRRRKSLFD